MIVFFWKPNQKYGYLCQWYSSPIIENGRRFPTAEHYMMYHKAILFQDRATAQCILETPDPKRAKELGRMVKGFNEYVWFQHASQIVENGNYLKFTQNPRLLVQFKEFPIDTRFYEASPYDRVWGIGFSEDNAEQNREKWGQNLLGNAISQVRRRLG